MYHYAWFLGLTFKKCINTLLLCPSAYDYFMIIFSFTGLFNICFKHASASTPVVLNLPNLATLQTVPLAVLTPNIQFLVLFNNCNSAAVIDHILNVWYEDDLSQTMWKGHSISLKGVGTHKVRTTAPVGSMH